ncbi:cell division protein ZapA [Enterococcus saigonensis]|uniref:Cell division protein ZapA n=1 Tax=Enterococcus saigonensis TaxID=1805431 RepID=A0A679I9D3_9ENTE|nr:cell division protein ZapA [Enterococcus saigonensis]BCA86238.1 cell division protein ZapA [Enterococcus saigonensis]
MVAERKRYKAVIANRTYTIIGEKSSQHMNLVTKLVNEQLSEIKTISPQINDEQAAILLAVNAVSDQVDKQAELLNLQKEVQDLREKTVRIVELENRIKRIEAIENEARKYLAAQGREDVDIKNHVQAQQILNEARKEQIKQKTSPDRKD